MTDKNICCWIKIQYSDVKLVSLTSSILIKWTLDLVMKVGLCLCDFFEPFSSLTSCLQYVGCQYGPQMNVASCGALYGAKFPKYFCIALVGLNLFSESVFLCLSFPNIDMWNLSSWKTIIPCPLYDEYPMPWMLITCHDNMLILSEYSVLEAQEKLKIVTVYLCV